MKLRSHFLLLSLFLLTVTLANAQQTSNKSVESLARDRCVEVEVSKVNDDYTSKLHL
jgi:hypothetical protein